MAGKYIVIGVENGGTERAIVFSPIEDHAEIASRFTGGVLKVLGAGFVSIGQDAHGELCVGCYGESVSLKVKSRQNRDCHAVKWAIFGDEPVNYR